jgi:predicted CoA-binding protein
MQLLKQMKTIALVGASNNPSRPSYSVMRFLLEKGLTVIPVNPIGGEILGQKVYAKLADIPDSIDMVDIFRNSEAALEIVKEAITLKPKLIWMQIGVINEEAKALAESHCIQVIMDKCPKIEWHDEKI